MPATFTNVISGDNKSFQFSTTVKAPYNVGDPIDQLAHDCLGQLLLEDVGHKVRAAARSRLAAIEAGKTNPDGSPIQPLSQAEVDEMCAKATLAVSSTRKDPMTAEIDRLLEDSAKSALRLNKRKVDKDSVAKVVEWLRTQPESMAVIEKTAKQNLRASAGVAGNIQLPAELAA